MPVKIHRRGEIWYFRGTVAGRRLRGSTGTADKAIAQRIAAEAEAREWKRHLDGPGAELTMAQAAIAYRQAAKPTRFLAKIEDHWKDTLVGTITGEAIRQTGRKLYPGAKAATWNRQVIVPTQAIINHAAELGWCPRMKVKRFKVETKRKTPVDLVWVNAFAKTANLRRLPHLGALCVFMFGTGARIGEAVRLTWNDIDLSAGKATIRQTKIEDTREAHLPAAVVAALANIPSNRRDEDLVFGYAWPASVKQAWDRVIAQAGILRLTPHSCRHGFATALLRNGYDVTTVAKLGGWKEARTVLDTYAHPLEDPTLTDAIFGTNLAQGKSGKPVSIRQKRVKSQ